MAIRSLASVKVSTGVISLLAMAFVVVANGADSAWLNGGIGADWPSSSAQVGGAWVNKSAAELDANAALVMVDSSAKLAFEATAAKSLNDVRVTVITSVRLPPYSALPAVPTSARTALIALAEGESVYYYALAANAARSANEWHKLAQPADESSIDGVIDSLTVILRRASSRTYVQYMIGGVVLSDSAASGSEWIEVVDAPTVSAVSYSGLGQIAALSAKTEALTSSLSTLSTDEFSEMFDGYTADRKAEVEKALAGIDMTDFSNWREVVCSGRRISLDDLLSAKNLDVSVEYFLPLMANEPKVDIRPDISDYDKPSYEFTILDGDVRVDVSKAKLGRMVKYAPTVLDKFEPSEDKVIITNYNTSFKVEFAPGIDKSGCIQVIF